ncbi:MAG: polymer-forming cytoskeletal protein [Alphaproteobacteria bacterium]
MFSKDRKDAETAPSAADRKQQPPSIISASLKIIGNLISEGDVQVDGIIEGDVKTRTLTVSENATVKGQVEAKTVRVRGSVTGQINAHTVELGSTGKVAGDIVHAILTIEAGASLEGNCRRMEAEKKPAEEKIGALAGADGAGKGRPEPGQAAAPRPEARQARPRRGEPMH